MKDEYRKWVEELFETYYDKVYGFLYLKVSNATVAQDLTAQTFLKVAEKLHTYNKDRGAISTWIFTIALNETRNHFRSQKKIEYIDLEDMSELPSDSNTEQAVIKKVEPTNLEQNHSLSRNSNKPGG